MRLVDEDEVVGAGIRVLLHLLELVDHGEDQAPPVLAQQIAQVLDGPGPRDRDVLLLHLAEQPIHPAAQLPFEFRPVHDDDHRGFPEAFPRIGQDQPGGGQQREGLAGTLGVPDQAAFPVRVGAALDDPFRRLPLVLAQHGLPGLAVLDIEEDPVPQRAQELRRLEERLDGEPVTLLGLLLPLRRKPPGEVPGDAVPGFEQVGHIEQLRGGQEFRRLLFVAPQLGQRLLDCVPILRVLVLHDGHRDAVHQEHQICPTRGSSRRPHRPFPTHPQGVLRRAVEVHQLHCPVAFVALVVPRPLPPEPAQHLPVPLDRGRQRLQSLDHRAQSVLPQPRVEPPERVLEFVPEDRPRLAAPFRQRCLRRERRPPDLLSMPDHRELDGPGLADPHHGQAPGAGRPGSRRRRREDTLSQTPGPSRPGSAQVLFISRSSGPVGRPAHGKTLPPRPRRERPVLARRRPPAHRRVERPGLPGPPRSGASRRTLSSPAKVPPR